MKAFIQYVHNFSLKSNLLDTILGHNLSDVVMLIDHETCLKFKNTFLCGLNSLIERHVLVECIVENRINKVAGVALCTLVNLLQSTEVVHPEKLGSVLGVVVATHEQVNLEWSRPQCLCHFSSHVLRAGLNTELVTSSELLEGEISLDVVSELVSVRLLTGQTHHLVGAQLRDLVFIVLKREDRPIDGSISHDERPVLSCYSERGVHFSDYFCFLKIIKNLFLNQKLYQG